LIDFLRSAWAYELRVIPVLSALLLILVPNAIRRLKRFYYVPIYFSVFPLRELNADLADYLGENYMYGGESDEDAAQVLRRRVITTSVVSVALSALVVPGVAGFGSAFFLPENLVVPFVTVFVVYSLPGIVKTLIAFPSHAVGTRRNTAWLVTIYVAYLGVSSRMIINGYDFARPFVERDDWRALLSATSDFVFSRVVAEFLLLAVVTTTFAAFITDRDIRRENLKAGTKPPARKARKPS
jgi:hypothetical protein